ncbi:hypothetical protein [Tissierella sp.]|uniref:hypothetical protein n=1 Tax=Tissierella sp. TaxID=41274 RepID=UPI00286545F3|nr:hypothetical protein [Tissierella sp.]MDR7857683.1 hypothetical protein [Tissierella sp.]
MGILGGLLKGAGQVVGTTSEMVLKTTGQLIGTVADGLGANDLANISRDIGSGLGEVSNKVFKTTGNVAGKVVDTAINVTTDIGGGVGEFIAEGCGADNDRIEKAKNIGKIVGGAAGGLIVGDVLGGVICSVAGATMTASTSTAISTLDGIAKSNAVIAQIGGGSLAAGGGGIAAGQAILNSINATCSITGGIQGIDGKKSICNKEIEDIKY